MKKSTLSFTELKGFLDSLVTLHQQEGRKGIFDVTIVENIPITRAFHFPELKINMNNDNVIGFGRNHHYELNNIIFKKSKYFDGEDCSMNFSDNDFISAEYQLSNACYITINLKKNMTVYVTVRTT